MKTVYESIINEKAYLGREEEENLIEIALDVAEQRNFSDEELDIFFSKLPSLRAYAEAFVDILGIEKYKEMEADNIRIIKERAWEDELSRI